MVKRNVLCTPSEIDKTITSGRGRIGIGAGLRIQWVNTRGSSSLPARKSAGIHALKQVLNSNFAGIVLANFIWHVPIFLAFSDRMLVN